MHRRPSFHIGIVTLTFCCIFSCLSIHVQAAKPKWRLDAERALLGTWEKTGSNSETHEIAKFKISVAKANLQIQFTGRDSADDLHVLARYEEANQDSPVVAFSLHKIGDDIVHVTLKLRDDVLLLEGVKIVNESSTDIDRFFGATYTRTIKPSIAELAALDESPGDDAAVAKQFGEKSVGGASQDEPTANKPAATKPAPKLGNIAGRIETASTLRGKLTLSPNPAQVRPIEGMTVGSSRPQFSFTNVPEGEYTMTFQGTVNGTTQSLSWKGLKIDVAGGEKSLSLKLR